MTLFTRIATTALTGLCALGMVGAAQAHHIPQQPFSDEASAALLRTARSVGIRVFTEQSGPGANKACKSGVYGMANSNMQLLICVGNHGGDTRELADTIRHELIHSVQFCKNGLLRPSLSDKFISDARTHLHWDTSNYEASSWAREAEARVLAQVLPEKAVAELLIKHCS